MKKEVTIQIMGQEKVFIVDCDEREDCDYFWSHSHHGVNLVDESDRKTSQENKMVENGDRGHPIWWMPYDFFTP